MMAMSRRGLVVAWLAVVATVAAGLCPVPAAGGRAPARAAYLRQVSSVCRVYARRLSRIGAPGDVAAYGDVISALDRALPLLRRQAAAMRAVDPPAALRPRLDRLFVLSRRSTVQLEAALAAAHRRDAGGVAKGLAGFSLARDRSHSLATAIGIRCEVK
jgi:hypothetical protein